MSLSFPNQSRYYDSQRHAVRFWGHDGPMETSFFILADALRGFGPEQPSDEAGFLKAFDLHRETICAAAAKAYRRGSKGSYDLAASDF